METPPLCNSCRPRATVLTLSPVQPATMVSPPRPRRSDSNPAYRCRCFSLRVARKACRWGRRSASQTEAHEGDRFGLHLLLAVRQLRGAVVHRDVQVRAADLVAPHPSATIQAQQRGVHPHPEHILQLGGHPTASRRVHQLRHRLHQRTMTRKPDARRGPQSMAIPACDTLHGCNTGPHENNCCDNPAGAAGAAPSSSPAYPGLPSPVPGRAPCARRRPAPAPWWRIESVAYVTVGPGRRGVYTQ